MAEEIAYKVSVDTGQGGKSLKDLKKDFKDAQDELKGLTEGTKEYEAQMKKIEALNKALTPISKTLKDLKTDFKDAQAELSLMTVGTKEYVEQLKKIGDARDEIDDLNDSMKSFTGAGKIAAFSNAASGLASGFQAAAGAAALFGNESEDVQKALLKIQAVMAFTEGLKGVEGLVDSFKVLGQVIKANPIIAFATALAAVTSAAAMLYTQFSMTSQATKDLTKELEDQHATTELLSRTIKRQIDLLTAQGGSEAEIIAKKKELIQQQIAEIETSIKLHERKLQDIRDNDSIWEGTLRIVAAIQSKLGQEVQANQTLAAIQLNKQQRAKEDLEAIAKEKQDLEDLKVAVQINAIDAINADKKVTAEYLAELEKRKVARKAFDDYNKQIEAEIAAAKLEDDIKKQQKEDLAAEAQIAKNLAEMQTAQDLADFRIAQKQREEEEKQAIEKASFEATMATAEASTNAMAGLSNFLFDLKRSHLAKGSAAELRAAKKQFQVNKALAISSNIISTIMGITNALSAQSVIPDPFGTILKVATAAAVGVSGTVATAKIASQKFEGGGASAGGGGGASPSISLPSPPTIAPPSQGNTDLNPDGTIKNKSTSQSTIKAYVVETDVTKTQKTVKSIEDKAKL